MTICTRCHRPLKRPTADGYGPVCRKSAKPVPEVERDLFGFDIDRACAAALERLHLLIASRTAEAHIKVRNAFRLARERLGVLA